MKKKHKDELIGRTITEFFILVLVALVYWWAFSAFESVQWILWAPTISSVISACILTAGAYAGYYAYKNTNRFYYRYLFYGLMLSVLGFYAAYSMYIRVFYGIWLLILLIMVTSIVYTTYRVNKR